MHNTYIERERDATWWRWEVALKQLAKGGYAVTSQVWCEQPDSANVYNHEYWDTWTYKQESKARQRFVKELAHVQSII